MFGIAVTRCTLSDVLIEQHRLQDRITRRSVHGEEEVHFYEQQRAPLLPVWLDGQLRVLHWGNMNPRLKHPCTRWCDLSELQAGDWTWLRPTLVCIPAALGFDSGIWYVIPEGLQGVVVTIAGQSVVYPLHQPATHYYQVMTRNSRMPHFLGRTI